MASQAVTKTPTPSTPTVRTPSLSTPVQNSTPGTWRHPRLDEITRRRNASTFTNDNLRTCLINAALLLSTLLPHPQFVSALTSLLAASLASLPPDNIPYDVYALTALRLLFLTNILFALRPLLSKPDECEDVPLTPSQRKLLGLNPSAASSSAPPSPASGYITPPRYARSRSGSLNATPHSGSSRRAMAGSSPLSGRNSLAASPYASPAPAAGVSFASDTQFDRERSGSPFLRNAVTGSPGRTPGPGASRRWSYGSNHSPLGLGRSGSDSLLGMSFADSAASALPQTPSPVGTAGKGSGGGKGASVGLNSKWLYEKGRSSLGGRGMY